MTEHNPANQIIENITGRALRNLSEYFACYDQPLPITHLITPFATKLSRNNIEWYHVEDSLKAQGCKVVLSPQNKKYLYPAECLLNLEEMLIEVISIEQEKNKLSGRKARRKRKQQRAEQQGDDHAE